MRQLHRGIAIAAISGVLAFVTAGMAGAETPRYPPNPAELTGHVFHDVDGDGVQDPGEPDAPGVQLTITDSGGNVQTVTTDAGGDWLAVVAAGDTVVELDPSTLPSGHLLSTGQPVTLVDAIQGELTFATLHGYTFVGAELTGHVYHDVNGNGTQDPGEPDAPGVRLVITDDDGIVHTVVTDVNGDWLALVAPGPATVDLDQSTLPLGAELTEGDDVTSLTAVAGASTSATVHGYELVVGRIDGHVYLDSNGDGDQDPGEPNLPNVRVEITRSDGTVVTVVTDANGDYSVLVPPGSTTVDIDQSTLPSRVRISEGSDVTTVVVVAGEITQLIVNGYRPAAIVVTGSDATGTGLRLGLGAVVLGLALVTVSSLRRRPALA